MDILISLNNKVAIKVKTSQPKARIVNKTQTTNKTQITNRNNRIKITSSISITNNKIKALQVKNSSLIVSRIQIILNRIIRIRVFQVKDSNTAKRIQIINSTKIPTTSSTFKASLLSLVKEVKMRLSSLSFQQVLIISRVVHIPNSVCSNNK
jgi:hypothetical protein